MKLTRQERRKRLTAELAYFSGQGPRPAHFAPVENDPDGPADPGLAAMERAQGVERS